jgi:hypothetical protein
MNTTQIRTDATEQRQKRMDQLNKILARTSDTERWRGIREFLLAYNPNVKTMDHDFILELNKTRAEQLNDFGSNKAHNIRQLMDMPSYLYEALITADPQLLPLMTSDDMQEQKRIWHKLTLAFPEYKIARKI